MKPSVLTISVLILACLLIPATAFGKPKTVTVKIEVDSAHPGYEGWRALDGNPRSMWHTRFGDGETRHPHEIVVDLGAEYEVSGIAYLPRPGAGNGTIKDYEVYVGKNRKKFGKPVAKGTFPKTAAETVVTFPAAAKGRYVRVVALSEVGGRPWTSIAGLRILCEGVEFRAGSSREKNAPAPVEWRTMSEARLQFEALKYDLRNRAHFAKVAAETYRPDALIYESDRDPVDVVLRRTAALLADLRRMTSTVGLSAQAKALQALEKENAETPVSDAEARFALFEKACKARRQIAFANPLLDFDAILFIKRHRSTFNHMCDQYYGINAVPGGGLFVLRDPFGPAPTLRDVLADSVVADGRLKDEKLTGGSFLAPELSCDAKTILFAYVECTGDRKHTWHTEIDKRGYWTIGRSYHIFRVNADGTDLVQLTDGTWNDFDPCWLPNGRIAFISERRGGYLRCGRVCPTYTLHDMAADGSDIRRLSPHETNEWHPSVTREGTIIYTRWDYVDRHGCTAHMPWVTTLDGRDSRAVHGNFTPRRSRPDMEVSIRAIPGSNRYVATAAPHHGQAFGSLVLIDPDVEDDDGMAPVRRITPEVGFPESQGGKHAYGTAWPLSEDYYLCVYDPVVAIGGRRGSQGSSGDWKRFNYGIYRVDSFGNKELIYRDPEIGCQSPIPLRPRPQAGTMPQFVEDGDFLPAPPTNKPGTPRRQADSTIAVIDVYDGLKPWPEGTRISAIRVIQVVPMSVPSGGPPHEIGPRLPSARDSVMPVRYVLGTAAVEADGSAHFRVPANIEVFFQALGADGLAVQSMRSATYTKPGEKLVCRGCHDRRHRAPAIPQTMPLALRKPPQHLKPDVDGSNPFSYPRLVQPVLDKRCVTCHTKHPDKAPDLRGVIAGKGRTTYYASYHSLAQKYGFWNYQHGYRTTPGQFGARASKLYQMLKKGHNDLQLTADEMHRITLWLDCCSVFYGVYERDRGQAQLAGKIVAPTLE